MPFSSPSASRERFVRETRATLLLAFPIVIGQLSQMLMGLTDSVMIGRAGTVPLAAAAFAGGVFNLFMVGGIGFATPVGLFTSRARGAQRPADAGEVLRHGVFLAAAFALIEFAVMFAVSFRFSDFGQPPEVLATSNPFFLIIAATIVPVSLHMVFRQFAESMGRQWVPMAIALASVVLNGFLNWVLIYGRLGAPALGLTGAGISTSISRVLGCVALVVWLGADPALRAAWPERWLAPLSRARIREMLGVGVPVAACLFFEAGAFSASAIMMGWLGAVPLAAHQIAITCAALSFMTMLGVAIAGGMRISAAIGAGERMRIRTIWIGGLGMGLALALAFSGTFLFLGHAIARAFVGDPAVVQAASGLLFVAALFQLFDGAQVINTSALRALPDIRVPVIVTLIAYWGLALPGGYLLGIRGGFGGMGIWESLAAGLAFAAILLGLRFRRLTEPGTLWTGADR